MPHLHLVTPDLADARALQVVGMFSALNRTADAFGVEFAAPAATDAAAVRA